MSAKFNNLAELQKKKDLLKKDIKDLEDLITFDNPKESLSAITRGFTDAYLKEEVQEDGEKKLGLNTGQILKEVTSKIKDNVNQGSVINFANTNEGSAVLENTLKIGMVALMGKFAKKSLKSPNWKTKLLGLALIYVAPIAIRYGREKLEEYQRNKTAESLEQLI